MPYRRATTRNTFVIERTFSATPFAVAIFIPLVIAGFVADGFLRIAASYLLVSAPLVWPVIHGRIRRDAAPTQLNAELAGDALEWRSWFGIRKRLTREQIEGSASFLDDGRHKTVLSLRKGPTVVVTPTSDSDAGALEALGVPIARSGTLRFETAWRTSIGTSVLRSLPLAMAFALDMGGTFGSSVYLLLIPPFQVVLVLAYARSSSFPLELGDSDVSLLTNIIARYDAIRSLVTSDHAITIIWNEDDEERRRELPLSPGHEWQRRALLSCLETASRNQLVAT